MGMEWNRSNDCISDYRDSFEFKVNCPVLFHFTFLMDARNLCGDGNLYFEFASI